MSGELRVEVLRLDSGLPVPSYAHDGDAGLDLHSAIEVTLKPGERMAIPSGIAVAIPHGFAGFVLPRSGRAVRDGLGMPNSPGLIDSGYRGEIKIAMINLDHDQPIHIRRGDKIAQMVVLPVAFAGLAEVQELPESSRGDSGFGSTGV